MPIVKIGQFFHLDRSNRDNGVFYYTNLREENIAICDQWVLVSSFQDILDFIKNNFHLNLVVSNSFSIDEIYEMLKLNEQLKDLI